MLRIVLFFSLWFHLVIGFAQVSYENRIEIPLHDAYVKEEVYPFAEKGFIIQSREKKSEKSKHTWKYAFYDSNLSRGIEKVVVVPDKFYKSNSYKTETHLHDVYRNKEGKFYLVTLDISTRELHKVEGKITGKSTLFKMNVFGDQTVFYIKNKNECKLVFINWKTGDLSYTPISIENYKLKSLIIWKTQVLEKSNELVVFVRVVESRKESKFYALTVNSEKEINEIFELELNSEKQVISVSATQISKNETIFMGTFSNFNTMYSEGVFFLQRLNGQLASQNVVYYSDLEKFIEYFPFSIQKDVDRKEVKAAKKGMGLDFVVRVADHDLQPVQDGFVFIGEVFYPKYTIETTTSMVNGVTTSSQKKIFDGFEYTHAIIIKFGPSGNLEWEKSFALDAPYSPKKEEKFISFSVENPPLLKMAYANNESISSKTIDCNTGEIKEAEASSEIETGLELDEEKYSVSHIEYWYENHFISYGFQKIKNSEEDHKNRKVFFVSKVTY